MNNTKIDWTDRSRNMEEINITVIFSLVSQMVMELYMLVIALFLQESGLMGILLKENLCYLMEVYLKENLKMQNFMGNGKMESLLGSRKL